MAKQKKEDEKFIVKMTQNAENDLDEIIMFIAKNNPRTSLEIMERIQNKIRTLDHFPNRGGYVPELLARNMKQYRQITEPPWKIVYKIKDNVVTILAIVDSRRNLQDVLIKKILK
jgi:addiction module RelE/StbE family toxin